ncbi:MAG: SPASM domain-containing protein [bacterium]|nr:SPASM domain-containing protein [bacterium]
MPKLSRYNQFYPWRDGHYLAFNARSGAVALMTGENYARFEELGSKLATDAIDGLSSEEQALLKQLEYGNFVHADSFDEIEHLKFDHRRLRFDEASLGLVIAPTMACNMACKYCFEENKKGRMSPQVVASLLSFVEKKAPRLTSVDVSWYGGEPLLALDVIEDITVALLEMGKVHNFKYTASMISNGYLLTNDVVDRLIKLKVSSIQVTLDGPARLHNDKRPLKNGKESFDVILQNLLYASTKMGIGVRVNVDKSFQIEMVAELLDQLEEAGLRDRVGVYFGLIEAATTACSNITESCYEMTDFSQIEIDYYALLLQRGFRIEKLPSPSPTFCMAQLVNSFLIDPDGDCYRCFNYVGDKSRASGNVKDPINFDHPNFLKLFQFDPFEDETCLSCNILPVCMGSCPARRADRGLTKDKICESWKYNLQPMLEIIAWSRQQAHQKAMAAKETV